MSFDISYDKQPEKFLIKIEKSIAKRILDKIDAMLINNPIPTDAKRIIGEHGVFRIRIGDYRALYTINYETKTINIFKIDKRENVY